MNTGAEIFCHCHILSFFWDPINPYEEYLVTQYLCNLFVDFKVVVISRIREEYNRVKAFVPDIEYPFNSSNLIPFFILCYLFVCVALSPADKISMICTAGILHPSVFVGLAE